LGVSPSLDGLELMDTTDPGECWLLVTGARERPGSAG
jgi:hypothetical protein